MKFRAIPETGRLRDYLRRLSARPHHLGSPYQKENAECMRQLVESWGWDATAEEFSVLFPTPRERLLEMTAPTWKDRWCREPCRCALKPGRYRGELPVHHVLAMCSTSVCACVGFVTLAAFCGQQAFRSQV